MVNGDGYPAADGHDGMTLVWSDEFDGTSVNGSNWTYDLGDSGWGNNEWQNYTNSPANSSVADGFLTITARQEPGGGYTSARMKSVDLQEFQFGRIDVRAKLPQGQGIWPAIWMLGAKVDAVGWPACGEIDIMEMFGGKDNTNIHGTVHYGDVGQWVHRTFSSELKAAVSKDWHTYGIEWSMETIKFTLDGKQYGQAIKATALSPGTPRALRSWIRRGFAK